MTVNHSTLGHRSLSSLLKLLPELRPVVSGTLAFCVPSQALVDMLDWVVAAKEALWDIDHDLIREDIAELLERLEEKNA